jgi:hypothetical protein
VPAHRPRFAAYGPLLIGNVFEGVAAISDGEAAVDHFGTNVQAIGIADSDILPPQPASPVSNASHMKVAQKPCGTVQAAAGTLGLEVVILEIRRTDDIAPTFQTLKRGADALLVSGRPPYNTPPGRRGGWCGVDLRNIEDNSARSGERAEAHSARLPAFLPETWAAVDSSERSGPFLESIPPILRSAKWQIIRASGGQMRTYFF